MLPAAELPAFQDALIAWFAREGKDYPWRRTTDPYAILVSELMLQQTTLAMVLSRRYFERWMEAFPDVQALAAAPEERVLALWEGLGYYSRARNLQKAARAIVGRHGGVFPTSPAEVLALPGVGRYTAGAVISFAFDAPAALVDGNVARVLARLFDFREEIDSTVGQKALWSWAEALVPEKGARLYNSGLMELGQRVCTVGQPRCLLCPVRAWCRAEAPAALPRKAPRREPVIVEETALFACRDSHVLLQQEKGRRRHGLWKLPAPGGRPEGRLLSTSRYVITHHRVTLRVHEAPATIVAADDEKWIPLAGLETLPVPSPYRKALTALLSGIPEPS